MVIYINILHTVDTFITTILSNMGVFAPILACLLIIVESIFPVLPLAVFITINFYYMGSLIGFIVSWVLTCIGCYISYKLCRKVLKVHFDNMLDKKEHKKLKKLMKVINNLKFEQLAVIIAIPFTPAFLVNIAAGLSNMNGKKFISAIIIGKIFLVYFWGFVGTSLIESLEEPLVLLKILVLIIIAFAISRIVNKKYHIE